MEILVPISIVKQGLLVNGCRNTLRFIYRSDVVEKSGMIRIGGKIIKHIFLTFPSVSNISKDIEGTKCVATQILIV